MMINRLLYPALFLAIGLGLQLSSCGPSTASESPDDAEEFFVFEVLPLIQSKCLSCHGDDPNKIEGELDLRSYEAMLRGGEHNKEIIVPGRPEFSPLYMAITREDPDFSMPPKERDALTENEIQAFYSWIVSGAPWPDDKEVKRIGASTGPGKRSLVKVATSGGQQEHWDQRYYRPQDLWAYKPLKKPPIPEAYQNSNPIDAFIDQKLTEVGIKPGPKASKENLIKRVFYGLTGLPPSPEEVEAFLTGNDDNAFEKLIDKLLASPHYGEHWARHWLDVSRYADSDGFSNDYARPSAWRYRDYVIRSFNSDKSYDQFILEQVAGDELDPGNPENLIATGFLRMGPWEHTGMSVAAETRQYFLDDVTNIVGETFLATPLNCAKCHDHKYDPIPTKDYYQIQAVFASTQFAERPAPFLPDENLAYIPQEKERVEAWLERIESERKVLEKKEEAAAKAWYQEKGRKYLPKNVRRKLDQQDHPPRYVGLDFADLGYRKILQKRDQIEKRNLERFEPLAFSVYSGPLREVRSNNKMTMPEKLEGKVPDTFILKGGSIYAPTDEAKPGVLTVLHHDSTSSKDFAESSQLHSDVTGRRLQFGQWLTHPENPLTARVMVNRIWQYHFSKGLAENSNNFGATGKSPSHPELLDWLASEFVENRWSIKHLQKLILTSKAYQRANHHPEMDKIKIKDPNNKYLAYHSARRLDAEEVRDAMLAASGELNKSIGGIPIRPEIPLEVALQPIHTMGSVAPAYQPSPLPNLRNRRSLYIERKRAIENPMLQVFNQNDNDVSCEKRDASTVVTQAFTLLNSENIRDRALALANKLSHQIKDPTKIVITANQLILLQKPTEGEIFSALEFIAQVKEEHLKNPKSKPSYPLQVQREMIEEMTGEEFTFIEHLDVYENYQPDLKDADVTVDVSALADYISVLFNTNEFLYVY